MLNDKIFATDFKEKNMTNFIFIFYLKSQTITVVAKP